ncbi:MAG: heparinase II/III family protein [Planctomycetes bacterium]|nr:heparinase II/III family protein [Planctomycetota bacterium]
MADAAAQPEKLRNLLDALDTGRPETAAIRTAPDPATALLAALARPPRGRFRFEYERKSEILAFLREHYGAWRSFDTAAAARFEKMTAQEATGPRATAGIAALGKAWWATGDERYGATFERFYLRTATGGMFNWGSFNGSQGSLELNAYFLLLDCPGFTTAGRVAFLDHLYAITCDAWDTHTSTWPQLSLGTEGHNWYLHGMHALPFFGLLFPEFSRSAFFVRAGWSVVEEHLRGHYKSDGGARETTLGYQCGNLRALWDFYLIAHRNGQPMSAAFADRLVRATRFVLSMATPSGSLPSFGDTYPGDVGLTSIAATAAALTGDRACKWYAEHLGVVSGEGAEGTPGVIPESAFWLTGLEGARTYEQTRALDPGHASVLLGPTGYAALRDSDKRDAGYMAVAAADRGPIVTSHGHNEVLGVDVHAMGVRFLGEMGPGPEGSGPARMYDQSTRAHNCLTIAGQEQNPVINEWRWSRLVIPSVRRWISGPTHDFFHGVHEGFYTHRSGRETIHARKIFFAKAGHGLTRSYWVVMDWVEAAQENDYRIYWHGCVPGTVKGAAVVLGEAGAPGLAIIPAASEGLALERDSDPGLSAYLEYKKLDAAQCPCFVYSRRAASDCFVWVIVPMVAGEAMPAVERLPVRLNGAEADAHAATAVRVRFAGCTDTLCVSHKDFDVEMGYGRWKEWGHLAFHRESPEGNELLALRHTMDEGVCGR